ncbi:hypothetical protein SDC9_104624 [bioreactor metagenome]|uniref:Uncharacterized protein n=1 Tax=bioreactor metagenome TaxID=1076179 RepID=A0A645AZR1_9ZZZZ
MVKDDAAVLHPRFRVLRVLDIAFFIQKLCDALHGRAGNDDHHKHHRQHHQAHQDLHRVADQAGQAARGQPGRRHISARRDLPGSEKGKQQHGQVERQLHQRPVERQPLAGLHKIAVNVGGYIAELLFLIFLPGEGLYHPDAVQVFLHHVVEAVIALEDAHKDGVHLRDDQVEADAQQRDRAQKDQRQPVADAEGKDQREEDHQRGPHRHADHHLKGILHVADIGGQAGDDAGCGKLIQVGKRKLLHIAKHIVPKVLGKAGRRCRSTSPGKKRQDERRERHRHQHSAHTQHIAHVPRVDAVVDQISHQGWHQYFKQRLARHQQRRDQRAFLIFPQAFQECFNHLCLVLCSDFRQIRREPQISCMRNFIALHGLVCQAAKGRKALPYDTRLKEY